MKYFLSLSISLALLSLPLEGATTAYLPTRYRGTYESPFLLGILDGSISVENFEDGAYDTNQVFIAGGEITHGIGVDEDSTGLDYDGRGQSIYHPRNLPSGPFRIHFLPSNDGLYPTHVGLVLLGYFSVPINDFGTIWAFGPAGEAVIPGGIVRQLPVIQGFPASYSSLGDEFVGFYSSGGIESISLDKFDFDHLQWGRMTVPEPDTLLLTVAASFFWITQRRRRIGFSE